MKGAKVSVVGAVIAAAMVMTGSAAAAQPKSLRLGIFTFPAGPGPNPLISVDVVRIRGRHQVSRGGREVAAWVKLTCTSSSNPPAGIPADQLILLRIPGNLPIAGHRSFGYSGPAAIDPIGDFTATARARVVLKARFTGRAATRTAAYPTGFRGSFASAACAAAPVTFAFPYL